MTAGQRAASVAGALLLSAVAAPACELVLTEHRSGRALARLPLATEAPAARIAFTHSVLGTPVSDHYEWRTGPQGWRAHLVEERYVGDGYGLPNAAGPGQTLQRDGDGWRLRLDRVVHPLVVRPLPAQHMRIELPDRPPVLLGSLSTQAVEFRVSKCRAMQTKDAPSKAAALPAPARR